MLGRPTWCTSSALGCCFFFKSKTALQSRGCFLLPQPWIRLLSTSLWRRLSHWPRSLRHVDSTQSTFHHLASGSSLSMWLQSEFESGFFLSRFKNASLLLTAGRAVWQACSSPVPCRPSSLRLNSSRSWIHEPWLMGHFTGSLCPEPSSLSSSPFALSTVLRLGSLPPPSFPPVFFSLLFLFSFPFLFPPLASPFLSFPFGYFRISCMLLVQKHGFFVPFL